MDLTDAKLYILSPSHVDKPFDCGDNDLNDFFSNKALHYSDQLLAVTYVIEKHEEIIAFFSIFNDGLVIEDDVWLSKSRKKKFLKLIPNEKRRLKSLPALKIGRFAVCTKYRQNGIGTMLLDYVKQMAVNLNGQISCRLILVDAYKEALAFYEKNGFSFLTEKDKEMDTRQMFFDVIPLIRSIS